MPQHSYDEAQERFVRVNAEDFTARELAAALGLGLHHIYGIGRRFDLKFKLPTIRKARAPRITPIKDSKVRPAAIYNQSPSPYGIATQYREL